MTRNVRPTVTENRVFKKNLYFFPRRSSFHPKLRRTIELSLLAARSKAWVCGLSLAELRVRNPPGHGCLSFMCVVCCQIEVSATS